ncbi:MAG: helix-turn-helix domain-containing protein [Propylenella sp.]
MVKRRRPNWRGIKTHRNYTVEEAARALGKTRITVRRWIKERGLPALQDRKPILILGGDLIEFGRMRVRPKRRCGPGELYCVRCRVPCRPAGAMVEFVQLNAFGGNLRAICEACGTLMHRRVPLSQLSAWEAILDVSIVQAPRHLVKRSQPCLNDHLQAD